jgi:SPX domain protein involved in polyphosphate accumulation
MTVEEPSWLRSGSKDDLVKQIEDFSPELQGTCSLTEDVKL